VVFLHTCANAIWSFKGPEGPPFYILVTFLQQNIWITLQRLQASSILNRAVTNLTTSWLPLLHDTSPISTINLLQATSFLYGKIWSTYYKWLIFDMDRFWPLVWANLRSHKLFLFFFCLFFLIPLYIFLIYCVSINKVLEGWIKQSFFSLLRKQR
jgi:hypothetical protein